MSIFTRVAITLVLSYPHLVPAQPALPLARVHVVAPTAEVTGELLDLTADSLVVRGPAGESRLARRDLVRAEVQDGTRGHKLAGFTMGTMIGAGGGALLGYASGDDACPAAKQSQFFGCLYRFTARDKAAVGAIVLGAVGGVTGLIAGAQTMTEHWIPLDKASPTVRPLVTGSRLGVSLGF